MQLIIKILLFFFLYANVPSPYLQAEDLVWSVRTLADFENTSVLPVDLETKLSADYNPKLSLSRVFMSPEIVSHQSMLVQIPQRNNQSFLLRFHSPLAVKEYAKNLIFHVYSSGGRGRLLALLRDSQGETHRIQLLNLHFQGWKRAEVPIPGEIHQEDLLFTRQSEIELYAIVYDAPRDMKRGKEDLFAIDDIMATVRDKRKMFKDPDSIIRKLQR